MVSIDKCREVLNKVEKKYTDKRVKEIRGTLEIIANYVLEMKEG